MVEGRKPTVQDLRKLGLAAGLSKGLVEDVIEQTQLALSKWHELARGYSLSDRSLDLIDSKLIARNVY